MTHQFMSRLTGAIAVAAAAALTMPMQPVLSQEAEPMVFCDYQPALEELVGEYKVSSGPSKLSSGGREIPLPQVHTYQATLAMIDGDLVLYAGDDQAIALQPISEDEPDWNGPDNVGGTPVLSTRDMELMLGCDMNTLVRLIGTDTATSQEGRQFDYTIRLFATAQGILVGGQSSWSVDGMTMRQRIMLEEIGN